MPLKPAVHLSARGRAPASSWETSLRYAAATAATLLAIAGAQLRVANSFVLWLTALTLAGVPVSLFLRRHNMKVGALRLTRPLWNALTVIAALGATAYLLTAPFVQMLAPLFNREGRADFWIGFAPDDFAALLMQAFLLFAAFRSFALISDKDATLCTVPSFSVLLLLIPVHKGIEVVFYFLAWTMVAAVLFALDHRSELRDQTSAHVPAARAGEDVRLGARSLASILGFSLLGAAAISMFLASREVSERSQSEVAITNLAARLTKYALSIPDVSINGGPERQIDFSSSPTLPTQTELWQVHARALAGVTIRPLYWRMLTLSKYDGKSWSQSAERIKRLTRTELSPTIFPHQRAFRRPEANEPFFPGRFVERRAVGDFMRPPTDPRASQAPNANLSPGSGASPGSRSLSGFGLPPNFGARNEGRGFGRADGNIRPQGFVIAGALPEGKFQAGENSVLVRQDISAMRATLGFLPLLPSVRAIQVDGNRQELRVRGDGVVNFSTMRAGEWMRAVSEVPEVPEYGFSRSFPPPRRLNSAQIAAAKIGLSARRRRDNLQLPPSLPPRVRALGRSVLRGAAATESNFRRAQRLALSVQQDAIYTLHPPPVPEGRDATDFFLFEGARRGYCTYFAGALTVLCRSEGIPARVVSGFVNTNDNRGESATFREANAHAWTEVWVDGWGWAVVDATPADNRGENSPNWAEAWQHWFSSNFARGQGWASRYVVLLSILACFTGAVVTLRKSVPAPLRRSFARESDPDEAERRLVIETYHRTSRQLSRHFRPRSAWETPDEWLHSVTATLSASDGEALRRLTTLYSSALYSLKPLPAGSAVLARHTASTLNWKKIRR